MKIASPSSSHTLGDHEVTMKWTTSSDRDVRKDLQPCYEDRRSSHLLQSSNTPGSSPFTQLRAMVTRELPLGKIGIFTLISSLPLLAKFESNVWPDVPWYLPAGNPLSVSAVSCWSFERFSIVNRTRSSDVLKATA